MQQNPFEPPNSEEKKDDVAPQNHRLVELGLVAFFTALIMWLILFWLMPA